MTTETTLDDLMAQIEAKAAAPKETVRYYIGDLCYVTHDVWDEICADSCYDNSEHSYWLEDGREYILFSTGGDGCFTDTEGNEYSVDSGTLGAIKVDDIAEEERENLDDIIKRGLAKIHEFSYEIGTCECWVDEEGIHFDHLTIEGGFPIPEVEEDED